MSIYQRINYKFHKFSLLFLITGLSVMNFQTSEAQDLEFWTFVGGRTEWQEAEVLFHSANFFLPEGEYFLNHTQLMVNLPSKSHFSLGIGYKQEYVKFPGRLRAEYRPMLHLYYNKSWGGFDFMSRNRLGLRFMDGELINRYRNKFLFSYNKFKNFTPFFYTEPFFNLNKPEYTTQRTMLGASIPIWNGLNLTLLLGNQMDKVKPDTWSGKFMLGTFLTYNF